ncbi:UDP-glucosyltransferase isoform X2 [Bombyx mori]
MNMFKLTFLVCCILATQSVSDAYKILVVFPMPGKSHSILGYSVVKHLLKAGHEVTYVTPFVEDNHHPNLTQVDVSSNMRLIPKGGLDLKRVLDKEVNVIDNGFMFYFMKQIQEATLEHEQVKKLLEDPNKTFDIVIVEWMYCELGASYAAVFDVPLIWLSTMEPHWLVTRLIDGNLNPAYNGDSMSSSIPPFTFLQRVKELWIQIHTSFILLNDDQERSYDRLVRPLIEKKGRKAPSFEDLKFNASLVLGNSHVSLGEATGTPQSYKPIAGYHIEEVVKPLPADLKEIMENAKHGVIYFSMGSNLKSTEMPDEMKQNLVKMFGELKQTIIWKFEEDFPNLPKNVHIVNWAPQPSILSHPNCVLFITHGGLLSTTESVHFGVPIVGIPVFGDQFINVQRAVKRGFAKKVDFSYSMVGELKVAIQEILSDSSYRTRIKELSLIYHDRPVSPGAELVHWVEHVARTRGALHLRSPALHVPFYQKLYLDLLAVVLIISLIFYRKICLIKNLLLSFFQTNEIKKKKKRN